MLSAIELSQQFHRAIAGNMASFDRGLLVNQMTADQFRRLALSLSGVIEAAHVGHPDFRVGGRIFATLDYPDHNYGVLVLTRDVQQEAIGRQPEVFEPVRGAWGRQGNTQVRLSQITSAQLKPWMQSAWQNAADKPVRRGRRR